MAIRLTLESVVMLGHILLPLRNLEFLKILGNMFLRLWLLNKICPKIIYLKCLPALKSTGAAPTGRGKRRQRGHVDELRWA